jgi:flagellar basal-body rod modification protein FlgD
MSAALSSIAPASTANSPQASAKKSLDTDDFVKLLITQLQNQDPTKPMTNSELLQQVSQIGTLQSQQSLQETLTENQEALTTTLTGLVMQNQIGAASNMIGKQVAGRDDAGNPLSGIVTSIRVANGVVNLELDTGKTMPMGNVSEIASQAGA